MKKLPIGISTLDNIRRDDYIYIDKTHHISNLVDGGGKYFFLSRPRRFGKSLFLDTLKQAFLANKAPFKGLHLESHWDWQKQYPVIHLDLGLGQFQDIEQCRQKLHYLLNIHFEDHQIDCQEQDISAKFSFLIRALAKKYQTQVVLLVDEYDKPIIDNIADKPHAANMREELKNLYSVIKTQDSNLKFVFLTGVSKFSKVSLFSGLNNLNDISLNPFFADICGYTQAELEQAFAEYLNDGQVDRVKFKQWYNGYNFSGLDSQKVYNPFDVLLFCNNQYLYKNYWFETATPSFLIKLLQQKQQYIPSFEAIDVLDNELSSFDVGNIPITTLLFQTGYLTIKQTMQIGNQYGYVLTYPNMEVKASLNESLMVLGTSFEAKSKSIISVAKALVANDFNKLQDIFNAHFASIPHDWYRNNPMGQYEGFYAGIIYSCFAALGFELVAEDTTSAGRIDLTIEMPDKVLLIEFKLAKYGSAAQALQQIKDKGYANKFNADSRPVYLIGMSFDEQSKSMIELIWQQAK